MQPCSLQRVSELRRKLPDCDLPIGTVRAPGAGACMVGPALKLGPGSAVVPSLAPLSPPAMMMTVTTSSTIAPSSAAKICLACWFVTFLPQSVRLAMLSQKDADAIPSSL